MERKRIPFLSFLILGAVLGMVTGIGFFVMQWVWWALTDLVGWQWNEYVFIITLTLVIGPAFGALVWFWNRLMESE